MSMPVTLLRSAISIFIFFAMGASQAKDILVVGTTFARIFEQNEQGEYVGLGADLARAIARQQGLTIKFGIYPWARAQDMVASGLADILIGPYKTPARFCPPSKVRSASATATLSALPAFSSASLMSHISP